MKFDGIVPEYEFRDFYGRVRFIDFVFYWHCFRIAIEIDGFDTHVTKMDREMFADSLERQNSLSYNDFIIVRFSYDQILHHPNKCAEFLKALLKKLENGAAWMRGLSVRERAVIQFALKQGENRFMVRDVMSAIGFGEKTTRALLKKLMAEGWLIGEGKSVRIRFYRLNPEIWNKNQIHTGGGL
ncbi:MAG TPA: hypothetical protein VF260_03240 [Bacilli bacterium]